MQITLTEAAVEQLKKMGVSEKTFLRLSIKPGGCAGMSYDATLDDSTTANDETVYENPPLRVVAHIRFLPLLDGLNIDFSDDLIRPGFVLSNPNVQQSCGCGASFSMDGTPAADCEGCEHERA